VTVSSRLNRRIQDHSHCVSLPAILITVVLLLPLALVWLPGGPPQLATSGQVIQIDWNTLGASLAVAAAAATLAVMLGAALAAVFVLTDFPGRGIWATVALVPFICPPTVWALGQVYCYSGGGLMERWCGSAWRAAWALSDDGHYTATTLELAQIHAPLAMLIVARGFGRLHHAGLQSARLFLTPLGMVRWTIAAVRQEAMVAFLLVLALSLGNFAIPHVLQCRLYPIDIYARAANYLDQAGALRIALPLLVVAFFAAAGIAAVERRGRHDSSAPSPPWTPIRLGRKRLAVAAVLLSYLALSSLLPLAAMVYECKSPGHFLETVLAAAQETENTLRIGLGASLVACLAGVVVGIWVSMRGRLVIDILAIAPLAVPTLVLGLAYLRFYNRSWPIDLTALGNTSVLVTRALATRGWPFVSRVVATGRRRIAPQWQEAASLGGLRTVGKWRWITGPLIVEHAATGALVAFILAAGDVEISQMLCAPGSGTLSVRLFSFLHFGPTYVAANLALLQLAIVVAPVLVYFLLTNRCLQIV